MKNTSVCYIEKDGKYLLLHRTKKKNDYNHGKWIGIGGKFEPGETPEQCALREVFEETGLTLKSYKYCGIVEFVSDIYENEYMHVFNSKHFEGEITECDEGELGWIDKAKLNLIPMWEGDKIFLEKVATDCKFFRLRLVYKGDSLVSHEFIE